MLRILRNCESLYSPNHTDSTGWILWVTKEKNHEARKRPIMGSSSWWGVGIIRNTKSIEIPREDKIGIIIQGLVTWEHA